MEGQKKPASTLEFEVEQAISWTLYDRAGYQALRHARDNDFWKITGVSRKAALLWAVRPRSSKLWSPGLNTPVDKATWNQSDHMSNMQGGEAEADLGFDWRLSTKT